jgi:hypothetical protein
MDLCNPTGDTINTMYDSVPYVFQPRSVMTLPDDAGRHVQQQGARFGIVAVHFGDDPDKIRYSGLLARVKYYRAVLEGHALVNARQVEMKFPPIVESDSVRQARIALPIYEKALGQVEDRLGNEAAEAYASDLEQLLLEAAPNLPQLKDATLTQLRDEATRVGVDWKPAWNYIELREAIEAAKLTASLPPAPASAPSPSGINVTPGPDPNSAPDDLAGGAFTRM